MHGQLSEFQVVERYGIEEQLKVYLRLGFVVVATEDGRLSHGVRLSINNICRVAVGFADGAEDVVARNIVDTGVEEHLAVVDNYNMVEEILNVVYLMRRDDKCAVIGHITGYNAAEEGLRRDVETVGGPVHEDEPGAGGKGKAHEHLLLLVPSRGP